MSKKQKDDKKDSPEKSEKKAEQDSKKETKKVKPEQEERVLPALDFSSLILPFFTHALITLGQIEEKSEKGKKQDMELVKRLIDLLDLFKDKTKGNLRPEEDQFLSSSLHQLRMAYMEKANIIKV